MGNGSLALGRKGKLIGAIIAILFVIAGFFGLALSAYANAGDVPAHSKSISDNHDGTYQLELTVTGDSDNETLNNSHVNVLIVYDESSSMSNGAGNGYSRADNAENAVYTFVNGLVGYQARGVDICMAEVGFGTGVNTRQNWTTSLTTIRGHYDQGLDGNVNGSSHGNYGYNGTNWAQALDRADTLLDDLDNIGGQDRSAYPTFVILVTDGAPTASPGNQTTVPGPNVNWINYRPHYRAAVDDALSIQSRENTSLYGIYAFGTDANLLDDLMYYANTGTHREINNVNINTTNSQNAYNFGNDDGADNYYTAANPQALDDAIAEIFNVIVQAMGITDVSMSDGTTNQVTTSSGEVAKLLEVDKDSYQYWMTIPLDENNQFKRTKNVNGNAETITYTVSGSTVTWTEGGASKSVTLDGSVENHQFKFEWTKDDFPNDFYEFAPEDAELVNGAVDWDLSNVGTLLDGVTYSVTFDVYPSQTALDYKARLDNGEAYTSVVDSSLRQYMDEDGNLKTNTDATLTYSDTRLDNPGPKTTGYTNPDPVVTESSSMTVKKEWEGASAPAIDLKLDILADGNEANPFYEATLNSAGNWQATFRISCGLIVDGKALPGALGHDFTFAELDDTQYRWELHAPTVRPMEIDGAAEPTILIKADPANGYDPTGKTQYTIDGATYYVDPAISTLTATNHRRSNLNLTKVVTGDDAPANATFPFEIVVKNSKAPASEPTDDPQHNSDYWVWFSIQDADGNYVTADANVSGATQSGDYFYAPSNGTINLDMKDGWNLRFTNLPTGTTYTFTEGDTDEFAFVKAENTGAADSTFAVNGQKASGTIVEPDAKAYEVTFTNDYQRTDLEITKVWNDGSNQDGLRPSAAEFKNLLTLSPAVQGAEPTVVDNGDNTYTITYEDLPRYSNGQEVNYTVAESAITGYSTEGSPAQDHGTITNSHTPEVTEVTVVKAWEDSDNIGKIRPTSIQAQLTTDGAASGDPVTLNAGNEWTYTWQNLPKYKDGTEIVYTADETAVPTGYAKTGPVKTTTDSGATFTVTNTYNPTPVSVDPPVQKVIEGTDALYNKGDFTFTIEATSPTDAPMPENTSITNSAEYELDGKEGFYEFGEIEFTMPGTYTYTVKESGEVDGVTNDSAGAEGKTITFTVEDDGNGNLTVTPTTDQVQLSFTNTYKAEGKGSFTATKELVVPEGMTGPTDGEWTFELTADAGVPMPETTTYTVGSGDTVTFGDIAYTEADAGKTYTYTVTESGTVPGVTNDTEASKTVTVEVVDNGDGTLTATASPEDGLTFTNTYGVDPAELELKAGKKLEVEDPANNPPDVSGEYTLTLAATGDAPLPEGASDGKVEITNADGNGTTTTFGTIKFTKPGEFQYTVSESGTVDGVTNGETSYTVKVKVSDNGDGSMSVEIMEGKAETVFTNTYKVTSVDKGLEVGKVLTGKKLTAGAFTFKLTAQGDAPMPENDEATNDADGMAVFDDITFEEPGTYTYTISEQKGSLGGVTYDESTVTATVEVKDNGKGALEATVVYDPEDATFTNTYDANGKFQPTVKKELNGRTLEDGQFEFELLDEDGEVLQTKTNDKSGSVLFDEIEYKLSDLESASNDEPQPLDEPVPASDVTTTEDEMVGEAAGTDAVTDEAAAVDEASEDEQPALQLVEVAEAAEADGATVAASEDGDEPLSKTFIYTIREKNDGKPGYEYDSHELNIAVTVTDNGDGTLKVEEEYDGSQTFTNTYSAEGSIVLDGEKTVTGNELADGQFTFELRDPDNKVQDTQTNGADGTFTFESLNFTEADAGKSYKYQIVEVNDGQAGYTYDSHVCTVTVSIADNGDGTLDVTAKYSDGETAAFENPYKPLATSAQFTATKTLEGRDLVADEFSFELADSDGNVVKTATNGADGTINFGSVEFDEAGTYTFTATEVKGDDSQITYDSSTKTYTVEVTDENGQLVANVTCDEDNPTFANTYQKKEEPVVPKTGDNLPLTALLTLAIGSGAAAFVARRRSMFAVEKANAGAHAQAARRNRH